jgi:GNAT superfamily N-acetyltransferase
VSADIVVRTATPADISALAALRWRWALPEKTAQPDALRDFSSALEQWMTLQRELSVCKIALLDGGLVGMAWLAVFDRVPNPDDLRRRSGDVQSVFVVPEHRGLGIGRRLIKAICDAADNLGIRKLTVDSNDQAVTFYEHIGFTRSDVLLQREGPRPQR